MTAWENAMLGIQIQHAARLLEILRDFKKFGYIYHYSLYIPESIQIQYRLTASSMGHICNEDIFARSIEMQSVQ